MHRNYAQRVYTMHVVGKVSRKQQERREDFRKQEVFDCGLEGDRKGKPGREMHGAATGMD